MEYLPLENLARLRYFGLELVWSTPPPRTYVVGAGMWRLIAVSPRIPPRSYGATATATDVEAIITLHCALWGVYVVQY